MLTQAAESTIHKGARWHVSPGKATFAVTPANSSLRYGEPSIVSLARRSGPGAIGELIAYGADPNSSGPGLCTVLMTAASAGNIEALRTLINNHADVNARTASGYTALSIAIAAKQDAAAVLLKQSGAK